MILIDRSQLIITLLTSFCNELMLAIEIDGCSHNERSEEDQIRQAKLESLGIRF